MTANIAVEIYHAPDGSPTCAADMSNGQVCRFLRARRFGTIEECSLVLNHDLGNTLLHRNGDEGHLIPCDGCPLHPTIHPEKVTK